MTAAGRYVAAIDQGTTSTRCIVFDADSRVVGVDQREHAQHFPAPGWVEHDALEIWARVQEVVAGALAGAGLRAADLAGVGIANQRETTVVWDRLTGRPIHNALVWQDTRTEAMCADLAAEGGRDRFRDATGLPVSGYFSATKLRWLLDEVPGAAARADRGELLFGTIDAWLVWNLTGVHATDVTNASRTMLMNLQTLDWDPAILSALRIPRAMLPEIRSSAEIYGTARGVLAGVPVAAVLGDQQAALFGQACFNPGDAKCTYGTGTFLLVNRGVERPAPSAGLLTTIGYRIGTDQPVFASEGSIADSGSVVRWLRDQLGIIGDPADLEALAGSVPDSGGCTIVPAFSGLLAPHWVPEARGLVTGLTSFVGKGQIARAALEATALQTLDVVEAVRLPELKVDGGMTANTLLMQIVADMLGTSVVRAATAETTSLGAAHAAGLATGVWKDLDALRGQWRAAARWTPRIGADERALLIDQWHRAVGLAKSWAGQPHTGSTP